MLLFPPTLKASYEMYIILLFPLAFSAIIYATRSKGYAGVFLCGLAFELLSFIALTPKNIAFGYLPIIVKSVK
jgi:hypothetical protein